MMKQKHLKAFMDTAERWAQESAAVRLKVGCIIVKTDPVDRIVSIGYNGTPPGWDNCCEYEELVHTGTHGVYDKKLVTKPEVIHAEENAIGKLARSTESGEGAIMFTTHAPCFTCSKIIATSGIKTVYYKYDYRDVSGINHLIARGVEVIKLAEESNVQ